jgi:hypothetical protein
MASCLKLFENTPKAYNIHQLMLAKRRSPSSDKKLYQQESKKRRETFARGLEMGSRLESNNN